MRKISTARSSRRAPTLKDSDYDHEIALVDHAAETVSPKPLSPEPPDQLDRTDNALSPCQTTETDQTLSNNPHAVPTSTREPQAGPSSPHRDRSASRSTVTSRRSASSASTAPKSKKSKGSLKKSSLHRGSRSRSSVSIPRVEVQGKKGPPASTQPSLPLCNEPYRCV